MNRDEMKGNWTMISGQLKSKRVNHDDVKQIAGKRKELAFRLRTQYGHTQEEAEKQIVAFLKSVSY